MKRIFNVAVVALIAGVMAVSCFNGSKSMVTKGNSSKMDTLSYAMGANLGEFLSTRLADLPFNYEKLEKGKTYTLKGVLMDKDTGKPLVADGKTVTAEKTFTAEKKNGTEIVSFSLNAKAVAGRTTVVFEKLLNESGEEIAAHEDINSKGQTIKIKGTAPAKTVRDLVMTGDYVDRSDYVFLMIIAGLVAAATFITRKRTGGFSGPEVFAAVLPNHLIFAKISPKIQMRR
jgi:hypothetical protein